MSAESEVADLSDRLKRIKQLTEQLFQAQAKSAEARALADRIHGEIQAARVVLRIPGPLRIRKA